MRASPLPRAAEPYRFLKQARHRASRLFLKDGARSSLPQDRQTSFSALAADRNVRVLAFLAFEVRIAFALAATGFVSVSR